MTKTEVCEALERTAHNLSFGWHPEPPPEIARDVEILRTLRERIERGIEDPEDRGANYLLIDWSEGEGG